MLFLIRSLKHLNKNQILKHFLGEQGGLQRYTRNESLFSKQHRSYRFELVFKHLMGMDEVLNASDFSCRKLGKFLQITKSSLIK